MPPPAAGARNAGYVLLRLPLEVRDLFREWLMRPITPTATPRLGADPPDARRQGLRLDLRQAHDRLRPLCLDDQKPLRNRLRTARLQRPKSLRTTPSISARPARRRGSLICFRAFFGKVDAGFPQKNATKSIKLKSVARWAFGRAACCANTRLVTSLGTFSASLSGGHNGRESGQPQGRTLTQIPTWAVKTFAMQTDHPARIKPLAGRSRF